MKPIDWLILSSFFLCFIIFLFLFFFLFFFFFFGFFFLIDFINRLLIATASISTAQKK